MDNPDSSAPDGDNCSVFQFLWIAGQDLRHQVNAVCCWNIGESDEARMALVLHKNQLAKICINRHKDTGFRRSPVEQHQISRIRTTLGRFNNVMPLRS